MLRLPPFVTTALRRVADAASVTSAVLARTATVLRSVAGEEARSVTVERPGEPVVARGRTAAERREPTPEPAAGATSAQASRRPSSPSAARNVRGREHAGSVDSVDAGPDHGRGGTPNTTEAENTPKERAAARAGRQAAPLGARDPQDGS